MDARLHDILVLASHENRFCANIITLTDRSSHWLAIHPHVIWRWDRRGCLSSRRPAGLRLRQTQRQLISGNPTGTVNLSRCNGHFIITVSSRTELDDRQLWHPCQTRPRTGRNTTICVPRHVQTSGSRDRYIESGKVARGVAAQVGAHEIAENQTRRAETTPGATQRARAAPAKARNEVHTLHTELRITSAHRVALHAALKTDQGAPGLEGRIWAIPWRGIASQRRMESGTRGRSFPRSQDEARQREA